jgi:hypothetical protein
MTCSPANALPSVKLPLSPPAEGRNAKVSFVEHPELTDSARSGHRQAAAVG